MHLFTDDALPITERPRQRRKIGAKHLPVGAVHALGIADHVLDILRHPEGMLQQLARELVHERDASRGRLGDDDSRRHLLHHGMQERAFRGKPRQGLLQLRHIAPDLDGASHQSILGEGGDRYQGRALATVAIHEEEPLLGHALPAQASRRRELFDRQRAAIRMARRDPLQERLSGEAGGVKPELGHRGWVRVRQHPLGRVHVHRVIDRGDDGVQFGRPALRILRCRRHTLALEGELRDQALALRLIELPLGNVADDRYRRGDMAFPIPNGTQCILVAARSFRTGEADLPDHRLTSCHRLLAGLGHRQ